MWRSGLSIWRGGSIAPGLVATVTVETVRWGVLAFVLARLATRLQDNGRAIGFALLRKTPALGTILPVGVAVGALVIVAMYGSVSLSITSDTLKGGPGPIANGEPVDTRLTIGFGLRNLVGEEIFARLGAQSIVYAFSRRLRGGAAFWKVAPKGVAYASPTRSRRSSP